MVTVVTTIFTILSILFVAARLWARFKIVKAPGLDDLLIGLALMSGLVLYAMIFIEIRNGLGKPEETLSQNVIEEHLRVLWISIAFYNLSLILSKLSALSLFLRIFRSRKFVIFTYSFMAVLSVAGFWMVLSSIFFCRPISKFWNVNYPEDKGYCLPKQATWYFNAAFQIASDVVILIMPMPLLWKLHLPWRQKSGIMLVFGVGIVVIATSIARMLELTELFTSDFTQSNAKAALWSALEVDVSIICACMAPIYPFLSSIFSWCFRPQPLHSSPATKNHSHSTFAHLTSSRKHSVHEPTCPDGGVIYNDYFFSGPGSYTASISKINTSEDGPSHKAMAEGEDGIRVVRELRMVSDVAPTPVLTPGWDHGKDFEMEAGLHFEPQALHSASGIEHHDFQYDWDLADFEFPDYKERMNAPV